MLPVPAHAPTSQKCERVNAYIEQRAGWLRAGDLMTALLLARLHERPDNLRAAVEAAVAGLQAVLQRTVEAAGDAARSKEATSEVCA